VIRTVIARLTAALSLLSLLPSFLAIAIVIWVGDGLPIVVKVYDGRIGCDVWQFRAQEGSTGWSVPEEVENPEMA
jgi:hypothetical protein